MNYQIIKSVAHSVVELKITLNQTTNTTSYAGKLYIYFTI